MAKDDLPEPTQRPVANPHAELERIASGAIALPVAVAKHDGEACMLVAPWHTTPEGRVAIATAVLDKFPKLAVHVSLEKAPPPEEEPEAPEEAATTSGPPPMVREGDVFRIAPSPEPLDDPPAEP